MPSDRFSKLTWHKRTHGHQFTGAEFRVLMSIFDHSDEHGRKAHPGLKLLMAETGYGKSAVSEALTALQARGWITQTRKGSGTSGKTSVYELVPDAPSVTAGAVPPETGGSTAGADQPTEVGPVERTSWSAGADTVVPLERTPTDPGSDPGSDPFRSDQAEVRYPPNHLEDQDEAGHASRPLAVEGKTEAPDNGAEYRPVGLQPQTARGHHSDDPWSAESIRQRAELAAEAAAREERAARFLESATAGGPPASAWD
jgi:hypothetical protein